MFLHSKFVGCLAISMIMFSARANLADPLAAGGIATSVLIGQHISSVPGLNQVNEKISDLTGAHKGTIGAVEAATIILTAGQVSGKMGSQTTQECAKGIIASLGATSLLDLARKNSTINSFLPKENTWGDQLLWGVTTVLLYTGINSIQKAREPKKP